MYCTADLPAVLVPNHVNTTQCKYCFAPVFLKQHHVSSIYCTPVHPADQLPHHVNTAVLFSLLVQHNLSTAMIPAAQAQNESTAVQLHPAVLVPHHVQ
jgi:hypothetical protein